MSFFNDLGRKAKNVGNQVASKSKDAAEQMKIESEIRALNKQIDEKYLALGKAFYEHSLVPETPEPDYQSSFDEITDLFAQVKEKSQRVEDIKAQVTCPGCGKSLPAETKYCPYCNAPVGKEEVKKAQEEEALRKARQEELIRAREEEQRKIREEELSKAQEEASSQTGTNTAKKQVSGNVGFCTHCGAPLEEGARFCTHCGAPVMTKGQSQTIANADTAPADQETAITDEEKQTPPVAASEDKVPATQSVTVPEYEVPATQAVAAPEYEVPTTQTTASENDLHTAPANFAQSPAPAEDVLA